MSLGCREFAIVSLGASCQTAHQLRANAPLIARTMGLAELNFQSSYFDFVVTPVRTLVGFVLDFPELSDVSELSIINNDPMWRSSNVAFVHNFRMNGQMGGPLDLYGTFNDYSSKVKYLRQKFLSMPERHEKIVFVLGNTQSNIMNHANPADDFLSAFGFNADRIGQLRHVLKSRFREHFGGLVVVEDVRSRSGDWQLSDVIRADVGPLVSDWRGNSETWGNALGQALLQLAPSSKDGRRLELAYD